MANVKLTSRASVKIGESFYTFEACIEKSCPQDMDENAYAQFKRDLWDECNAEVDTQIAETVEFLKKKR